MVAVFILLLCIAPAMRIFTSIYQSQHDIIRENQKNHLVHLTHAKFTEQLYKRLISFEDVKEKKDIVIDDPELIEQLEKSGFQCCGRFSIEDQRKIKGKLKYLCKLEIQMKDGQAKNSKQHSSSCQGCSPETYEYYICINTWGQEGDEDEEDDEVDDEDAAEDNQEDDDEDEDDEDEDEDETPDGKKPPMKSGPKNPEAKIAKGGLS